MINSLIRNWCKHLNNWERYVRKILNRNLGMQIFVEINFLNDWENINGSNDSITMK